jgi:hypothetical protein
MRVLLLGAVALLFSCADPLCGCSEPGFGVVLKGTLLSQSAVPLPGWRVRAQFGAGTCSTFIDTYSSAVTDPAGRLALRLDLPLIDSVCVQLFARDTTAGAPESPLEGPLRLAINRRMVDTLNVSLVLAP